MDALDLSKTKPRKTRDELAGVVFLPRSIDKFRAALPGGELNGYTIEGFTSMMLEKLDIPVATMQNIVATSSSDDDIAGYVLESADPNGIKAWNEYALNRELYKGDRATAEAENPWLKDHPEITKSLDFLQYMEDHGLDND